MRKSIFPYVKSNQSPIVVIYTTFTTCRLIFANSPPTSPRCSVQVKLEGGHRVDTRRFCRLRVIVHIHFVKFDGGEFFSQFFVRRSDSLARSAPGGSEIDHHLGFFHRSIKFSCCFQVSNHDELLAFRNTNNEESYFFLIFSICLFSVFFIF